MIWRELWCECGFGFQKLIGTAISIQSSKELIYPSITICKYQSEAAAWNYTSTLNETLLAVIYHAPNGSQQEVSQLVPDVENRDWNLALQRFILELNLRVINNRVFRVPLNIYIYIYIEVDYKVGPTLLENWKICLVLLGSCLAKQVHLLVNFCTWNTLKWQFITWQGLRHMPIMHFGLKEMML